MSLPGLFGTHRDVARHILFCLRSLSRVSTGYEGAVEAGWQKWSGAASNGDVANGRGFGASERGVYQAAALNDGRG